MIYSKHRPGFTLIELLLVIGIIGVLAAIVILAINPAEQLRKAFGAEKTHSAGQLQKAMTQFLIDHQELPGDKAVSTNFASPTDICALGKSAVNCTNIDELLPTYIGCIPYDELETNPDHSGYQAYVQNGFIRVLAKHNDSQESGGTGCTDQPIPIAYWKLNESSIGATIADSGPNGFTATVSNVATPHGPSQNTPTLQFSNPYSWQFDGTEDYASVPNDTKFNLTEELTISAWVYNNGFSAADTVNSIVRKGEANPNMWQLAIEDSRATLMLESGDGANGRAQGASVLTTGIWYHVAGTWDGTTATVYVNGIADGSGAYTGSVGGLLATDSRPIYVGGRIGSDSFNGYLDDVRVYDVALSAVQISKLAAGWK